MAGRKGRSGRRPQHVEMMATSNSERATFVVQQFMNDERIPLIERVKVALPVYLKTMTEKQAVVSISASMSLDTSQVAALIELAQRNSLIYKDLDNNEIIT